MLVQRKPRLPLYAQIKQRLEQEINEKKILPGQRIPSEAELSALFGASRMTVRRAIDQLVSQGKLRRAQGQGTFVAEQPVSISSGVTRWSFELARQAENSGRAVVAVTQVLPTFRISNALRTMPSEPITEVGILLTHGDERIGYSVARIPSLLIPGIDDWDLNGVSLTEYLHSRAGLEFGKVEERVRAIPADDEVAEMLLVEPGNPVLYVDSLVFLASGIPVILSDTFYRGDRFTYRGLLRPLERVS